MTIDKSNGVAWYTVGRCVQYRTEEGQPAVCGVRANKSTSEQDNFIIINEKERKERTDKIPGCFPRMFYGMVNPNLLVGYIHTSI